MNISQKSSPVEKPRQFSRRDFGKKLLAGSALSLAALSELNAGTYQKIHALNLKHIREEAPDGVYWDLIREHYLFQDGLIMMNNGTVGPMPRPVFNCLINDFRVQATNPFDFYHYFPQKKETIRAKLAEFIHASPGEVALTRNTTEGMNFIANGLDLKPGDQVLISSLEHPAGIHPWKLKEKRCGIQVTEVPLGVPPRDKAEIIDAFRQAITPRTRVISISHTVYLTGLIFPLIELCELAHRHDILVLADSAHGLGMLNLDMRESGVDFFTSSPYKWMGAPAGRGLLYVKKAVQDRVWPTIANSGWDRHRDARKFETLGQRADPLTFALGEAIEFQKIIGKNRIERRIKALAAYLKKGLQDIKGIRLHTGLDPSLSGGLTAFSHPRLEPLQVVNYLREKYNLVVRTIGRDKDDTRGVRVSTNIFVSYRHIDLLLEGIAHLVKISA